MTRFMANLPPETHPRHGRPVVPEIPADVAETELPGLFPEWRIEHDQPGVWRARRGDELPVELIDPALRTELEAATLFELGEYLRIQANLLRYATTAKDPEPPRVHASRLTWQQIRVIVDRWEFVQVGLGRSVAVRRHRFEAAEHSAGCTSVVVAYTIEQAVGLCWEQELLAQDAR